MNWLKALICRLLGRSPLPPLPPVPETFTFGTQTFRRIPRLPEHYHGRRKLANYRYYCPHCQAELTEGPSGAGSVNAVCRPCGINFGCLPDCWFGWLDS